MHRYLAIMVVLLVAGGCALADQIPTTTTPPDTSIAPASATTAAGDVTDGQDESPCLTGDRPFAQDGVISAFGGANGDATQISGVRWAAHPGCERVVVDLLTADGAPAGAIDPAGVEFDSVSGVIRVNLPDAIVRSALADSLFDGDLVTRAYVVATAAGNLAIDVHTAPGSTLALRAFEVDSPSRIVIDVRSQEGAPVVLGAAEGAGVVVLSPTAAWAQTTVEVRGYVQAGLGDVGVRAISGDTLLLDETIAITHGDGMWREFATTLRGLPASVLAVEVGATGAGSVVRVEIDATVEPTPAAPDL